ncbi:MAG: hypothetical protein ACFFG0_41945 [Candidatus Thorarchaeota archaeon]
MALFSLTDNGLCFMLQKNNEDNANEENQKVFLVIKMVDCKNKNTKNFFKKLIKAFEKYENFAGLDASPPINYFLEKSNKTSVKIYHLYNNITYKNGISHAVHYMAKINALDKNNAKKLKMHIEKYNRELTDDSNKKLALSCKNIKHF